MARVFAAADIGSNTVHLLVAQVDGASLLRLRNDSEWLSLGEVVRREGHVPENLARKLISTLKSYKLATQSLKADGLYVFATEAMRMAENHDDLIARIRRQIGLEVDLIPARREAELSLSGVQLDCAGPGASALIEVGGGSVQVARCGDDGMMTDEYSLPIGTGRLIVDADLTQPSDPGQIRRLDRLVGEGMEPCRDLDAVARVVASGGVARGLWRSLHPDGDRTIAREELDYLRWVTARLDLDTLCSRFGVKVKRAATLLPGAVIFRELLDVFNRKSMIVSEYGVREGAILEMAKGRLEPCRA